MFLFACLHVQKQRGCFGGPAFIQSVQSVLFSQSVQFKKLSKSSDWLEKAGPRKKPLVIDM